MDDEQKFYGSRFGLGPQFESAEIGRAYAGAQELGFLELLWFNIFMIFCDRYIVRYLCRFLTKPLLANPSDIAMYGQPVLKEMTRLNCVLMPEQFDALLCATH